MEIYVNLWRPTDPSQAFALKSYGSSSTIIDMNSQILSKQLLVFPTLFSYSSRSSENDGWISGKPHGQVPEPSSVVTNMVSGKISFRHSKHALHQQPSSVSGN